MQLTTRLPCLHGKVVSAIPPFLHEAGASARPPCLPGTECPLDHRTSTGWSVCKTTAPLQGRVFTRPFYLHEAECPQEHHTSMGWGVNKTTIPLWGRVSTRPPYLHGVGCPQDYRASKGWVWLLGKEVIFKMTNLCF